MSDSAAKTRRFRIEFEIELDARECWLMVPWACLWNDGVRWAYGWWLYLSRRV